LADAEPTAVVLLPIAALVMLMDTVYGHRPLQVGEDTMSRHAWRIMWT